VLYRAELERNLNVCPKCSHHMRISARLRLQSFLDPGDQQEIGVQVQPEDPLKFKDSKRYKDRLAQAQKVTGERNALIALAWSLQGEPIIDTRLLLEKSAVQSALLTHVSEKD